MYGYFHHLCVCVCVGSIYTSILSDVELKLSTQNGSKSGGPAAGQGQLKKLAAEVTSESEASQLTLLQLKLR